MQQAARPLPVSLIVSGSVHLGLMLLLALTAKEVARDLISVDFIEVPPLQTAAPAKPAAPKISSLEKAPVAREVQTESEIPQVKESAVQESSVSAVSSEQQINAKQIYQSQLMRALNSKKSYPALAKKLRQEGLVVVQFRVARSGQILEARVVKESPFQSLNQSAKDLVESLKGLAPLPQEITETTWLFEVPVQYQM